MRAVYRVLAYLVALGVFVQAAVIAFAWFMVINEIDSGLVLDENYEGNVGHMVHGIVGMMVIPALALLLLISSFFAKIPGGVKRALLVFGVVVLQVALAIFAFGLPAIGLLHGINALVLLGVALMAGRKASAPVVHDTAPGAHAAPAPSRDAPVN